MPAELLRIYEPRECDEHGVPLDWACCRTCAGEGRGLWRLAAEGEEATVGRMVMVPLSRLERQGEREAAKACVTCGGLGSLRAAARASRAFAIPCLGCRGDRWTASGDCTKGSGHVARDESKPRCEGCGHPMGEATWTGAAAELLGVSLSPAEAEAEWLTVMGWSREPDAPAPVRHALTHWSPCDVGCQHAGEVRVDSAFAGGWTRGIYCGEIWTAGAMAALDAVEAPWRAVDVRTLGWAADLRPEKLAVLCLRCWTDPELPYSYGKRA